METQEMLDDIVSCSTLQDLQRMVGRFARSLGYETFNSFGATDRLPQSERFRGFNNMPDDYLDNHNCLVRASVDPVMQHCKLKVTPILWDQSTYVELGLGNLWEEMAGFGLASGIAVAIHAPGNVHSFIGFDSSRRDTPNAREAQRLLAHFQLFSAYAAEPIIKFLTAARTPSDRELSAREKECLRWTSEGKTVWETSKLLGVSQSYVKKIHSDVIQKLNCANATQAACKALRDGHIA